MKNNTFFLSAILIMIVFLGVAKADLIDYGLNNEMFFDTTSNQYFYDPQEFQGQTREEIGLWLDNHPTWRYAKPHEISQLLSNDLPIGDPSGTSWMIMGKPTSEVAYETAGGSSRILFHWEGWMSEIPQDPAFFPHYSYVDWAELTMGFNIPSAGLDEIYFSTTPGYQYDEYAVGGAWLVTDIDPLSTPVPMTLLLLSSGILGLAGIKNRIRK